MAMISGPSMVNKSKNVPTPYNIGVGKVNKSVLYVRVISYNVAAFRKLDDPPIVKGQMIRHKLVSNKKVEEENKWRSKYEQYSWNKRKKTVMNVIKSFNADVIFLQEVIDKEFIMRGLEDKYDVFFYKETARKIYGSNKPFCYLAAGIKKGFFKGKITKFTFDFDKDIDHTASPLKKSLGTTAMGFSVGKTMAFINTHVSLWKDARLLTAKLFKKVIPKGVKNVLITGDINAFADIFGDVQASKIEEVTKTKRIIAYSQVSKDSGVPQKAERSFLKFPFNNKSDEAIKKWKESGNKLMPLDQCFISPGVKGTASVRDDTPKKFGSNAVPRSSDHFPLDIYVSYKV